MIFSKEYIKKYELDLCQFCGTLDYIKYKKEPSNDPDCHDYFCSNCNLVVCERCRTYNKEFEIYLCPGCVFEYSKNKKDLLNYIQYQIKSKL